MNFNRWFIKNYSLKAEPLTRLTRKDHRFDWTKKCEKAYRNLVTACTEDTILLLFSPDKEIRIETDASDLAIGACLCQLRPTGKWQPVAYHSRKMSPAEQNYDIHDKELLAIVVALQHWRTYVEGSSKTTIFTDYKNLLSFTTTKVLNRRQVRWSELLGQYKFEIKYTPGKDNGRADALSRRPDYINRDEVQHTVLKLNKNGSLSANTREFDAIAKILKDKEEEFPIFRKKLYVPTEQIWDCIRRYYEPMEFGHPGIANTVKAIQRNCHFGNIKMHVRNFIRQCENCQKNKHSTHINKVPQTIELVEKPWQSVTMDFITKLPLSENPVTKIKYDSIWVIIDRYSKWVHCFPFKETYTAKDLEYLWRDRFVRIHGNPQEIISDRDKLFTSAY